ncbi:MAG: hypothetical protein R2706_09800 [Acidimicrobiales bacterium]
MAVVSPAALHIPWSYDVLAKGSWSWLVGPNSAYANFDSMADLVRFARTRGLSLLAIGVLLAAGVALVVGRGHRFDAGATGWIVATVALSWCGRATRRIGVDLPAPELVLCLLGRWACASRSAWRFVRSNPDLAAFRFGWRQGTAIAGLIGIALPQCSALAARQWRRWDLPTNGYGASVAPLTATVDGTVRVLFIGDPGVMPIDTLRSEGGISYAVSDNFAIDATRRWVPGAYGESAHVGELLDLAASGDTARLGRLLSAYGIDLVVVVPQIAPPPFTAAALSGGAAIEDALASQLDLKRVTGTPPLLVYRNASSNGPAVSLDVDTAPLGGSVLDLVAVDLAAAPRVPLRVEAGGRWVGDVPADKLIVVAADAAGWSIEGARDTVGQGLGGNIVVGAGDEGAVTLSYRTDWVRRALLAAQFCLVFVGVQIGRQRRRTVA